MSQTSKNEWTKSLKTGQFPMSIGKLNDESRTLLSWITLEANLNFGHHAWFSQTQELLFDAGPRLPQTGGADVTLGEEVPHP